MQEASPAVLSVAHLLQKVQTGVALVLPSCLPLCVLLSHPAINSTVSTMITMLLSCMAIKTSGIMQPSDTLLPV
jgi:hypothetical protein